MGDDKGATVRVRVPLFGPGARRGSCAEVEVVSHRKGPGDLAGGSRPVELGPHLCELGEGGANDEHGAQRHGKRLKMEGSPGVAGIMQPMEGGDELVVACTPISAEPTPQVGGSSSPGLLDALEHTPTNLNARFYAIGDDDSPAPRAGCSFHAEEPHAVQKPGLVREERSSLGVRAAGVYAFEYSPIPSQASDGDAEAVDDALKTALRRGSGPRGGRMSSSGLQDDGIGAAASYMRGLAPPSARSKPAQVNPARPAAAEAAATTSDIPPGVFTSVRTGRSMAFAPTALAKGRALLEETLGLESIETEPAASRAANPDAQPELAPVASSTRPAPTPGMFASARTGALMVGPSASALERGRRLLAACDDAEEDQKQELPTKTAKPAAPPHTDSLGMFSNARTGRGVSINAESLARGRDFLAKDDLSQESPRAALRKSSEHAMQPAPRQPLSDARNRAQIMPIMAMKPPLQAPTPRQQLGMTPGRAGRASVTPGRKTTPVFRPPAMVSPGMAGAFSRGSAPPASPSFFAFIEAPSVQESTKSAAARVSLRTFFEGARPHSSLFAEGSVLVPSTSDEAAAFRFGGACGLGHEEVRDLLVRAPAIDPAKASPAWVANHWRWIVWKLASYIRAFPGARSRVEGWFTPAGVLERLEARYRTQFVEGRRSALHRVLETDAHPGSHMVLCVARVLPPHEGGVEGADALRELELTDGWWGVTGVCDPWLSKLVGRGKICAGQKLRLMGCKATGLDGGLTPLSPGASGVRLSLHVNGTRRARWDTRLGFAAEREMFTVPLGSVLPLRVPRGATGPGLVPGVFFLVQRVYPALHRERRGSGEGEVVFLGEEAEAAVQERLLRDRILAAEAIVAAEPHLDAEVVSAKVLEKHPDRDVSRAIRARVTGVTGRRAEAIVTLWESGTNDLEGSSGMEDYLVEGAVLLAGPLDQANTPCAGPFAGLLHLVPRRGCQWHVVPEFSASAPHPLHVPRCHLLISELEHKAATALPGAEFDITGLVLRAGTPKWGAPGVVRRYEQWVFLCDGSNATRDGQLELPKEGPSGIVALRVTASSTERDPFQDVAMERRVCTFRNVAYVEYDSRFGVHQASFSEMGRVTSSAREKSHRARAEAIEAWAGSASGTQKIAWMQELLARMMDN